MDSQGTEEKLRSLIGRLLKSLEPEDYTKRLLKVAYDASPRMTTLTRIRALTVLFSISTIDFINKIHEFEQVRYEP